MVAGILTPIRLCCSIYFIFFHAFGVASANPPLDKKMLFMIQGVSMKKEALFRAITIICAYTFLGLPFVLFAFGWLRPALGIPAGLAALVSLFLAIRASLLSPPNYPTLILHL